MSDLRAALDAIAKFRPAPDAMMDGTPSGQELREWWFEWAGLRDRLRAALASVPDEGPTRQLLTKAKAALSLYRGKGDVAADSAYDALAAALARPAAPVALDVDKTSLDAAWETGYHEGVRRSRLTSVTEWLGPCCTHPEPGCVTCGFVPDAALRSEEPTDDR